MSRLPVKALAKACRLLADLAAADGPQTLSALAKAESLPPSTAFRLLDTLRDARLVEQLPDRRYRVGVAAFGLARAAAAARSVVSAAEPAMASLVAELDESASLVIFHGQEAHHVRCLEPARAVRASPGGGAGGTMPLHCSGSGKVLLSALSPELRREVVGRLSLTPRTPATITSAEALLEEIERVARQGYAIDDQEREEDLVCIAVPVRDHTGAAVAALSISGHISRMSGPRRAAAIAGVVAAGARVSAVLGADGSAEPPRRVRAAPAD